MRRSSDEIEVDHLVQSSATKFFENERAWSSADLNTAKTNLADSWQEYASMGWLGMGLSEELGGIGGDIHQCMLVLEEAGKAMLPDSLLADMLLAPHLATSTGSDTIAALIPDLTTGKVRFSFALPAGTIGNLNLRKTESSHILNGRTAIILSGASTTHWIIAIPANEKEDAAIVILEANWDTAARKDAQLMSGGSGTILTFENFVLPGNAIVVAGQTASACIDDLLDLATAGIVSDSLGTYSQGFNLTIDYLNIRKQFGKPLSSFQAVQHLMADSYCALEGLRSLHLAMVSAFSSASQEVRHQTVAAAKAYIGTHSLPGIANCIQVSGGIAITDEYQLGHIFKRLQTNVAFFGSTETHLETLYAPQSTPVPSA